MKTAPRLDFIAEQLESGIRTMRLLPMSTLFGLFPRLVHDLAREQRKEAELVVEGEETVADKRVLEEMKDPLMHMLRNAIGHGIESPEQREQAGKPRSGTIRVKASQTPASIIIEVSDDGRGLDLDEIKRTALKHGMYSEEELAGMSAAQLQSLILVSGFSTTSFVTDVSGRGVGLDVVRNNVERLKGVLQIESCSRQGPDPAGATAGLVGDRAGVDRRGERAPLRLAGRACAVLAQGAVARAVHHGRAADGFAGRAGHCRGVAR